MEHSNTNVKRRKFLKQSLAAALSFSVAPSIAGISKKAEFETTDARPPLPAEMVYEFVGAAHANLPRVKEMLAKEPLLVNACWDWGGGDFELAIGGAAHMGSRDVANYLLDHNARIDIFCAAMLGEKEVVASLIKMKPGIVNVRGPHTYPLLYHVALSGDVPMAVLVRAHLEKERVAADCNRSLHAAVGSGHTDMVEWLLVNGADNPNVKNIFGKSPLEVAETKGFKQVVLLLKKHGAH